VNNESLSRCTLCYYNSTDVAVGSASTAHSGVAQHELVSVCSPRFVVFRRSISRYCNKDSRSWRPRCGQQQRMNVRAASPLHRHFRLLFTQCLQTFLFRRSYPKPTYLTFTGVVLEIMLLFRWR